MKLYANLLTLIVFLLLRLPGLRERVDFSHGADETTGAMSSGLTAIIAGGMVLSTNAWVGGSHLYEGNNWVNVLRVPLLASGIAFAVLGLGILLRQILRSGKLDHEWVSTLPNEGHS